MASLIVGEGNHGQNEYFYTRAKGLICYWLVFLLLTERPEKQTLANVAKYVTKPSSEILAIVKDFAPTELLAKFDIPALEIANQTIQGLIEDDGGKAYRLSADTAYTALSVFTGSRVARAMSRSDWNPSELRSGKITIYVTIDESQSASVWAPLLRLFTGMHMAALKTENIAHDGKRVNFVLDEIAVMKNAPEITENLDRGRTYGIRQSLYYQTIDQIERIYDSPSSVYDNVGYRCYMSPSGETARKLSEDLGVVEDRFNGETVPLERPENFDSGAYADKIIIEGGDQRPLVLRKFRYWEDFASFLLPPPPVNPPKKKE